MARVSLFLTCVLWAVVGRALSQTGLSDADKQELLDAHNRLRSSVDPPATDMQTMVWNDELAQVAQDYAEQCIFDHNDDRVASQSTFSSVGENLFITTASTADYSGFVQSWYNEVEDYNYFTGECSAVCGHYTQVVWATSNNLGCGAFRCSTVQGVDDFDNGLILVCNYGPAGNFVGERPYTTSATAPSATAPSSGLQLQSTASIVLLSALIAAIQHAW